MKLMVLEVTKFKEQQIMQFPQLKACFYSFVALHNGGGNSIGTIVFLSLLLVL